MVAVSAQGAASELKPKVKRKKEYVHILTDSGDSPGKILGVYRDPRKARKEQEESMAHYGVRYTSLTKHEVF